MKGKNLYETYTYEIMKTEMKRKEGELKRRMDGSRNVGRTGKRQLGQEVVAVRTSLTVRTARCRDVSCTTIRAAQIYIF